MAFESLFGSNLPMGLLIPHLPHAGLYETIGSLSAGENPAVCFAVYVNRAVEQRSASIGKGSVERTFLLAVQGILAQGQVTIEKCTRNVSTTFNRIETFLEFVAIEQQRSSCHKEKVSERSEPEEFVPTCRKTIRSATTMATNVSRTRGCTNVSNVSYRETCVALTRRILDVAKHIFFSILENRRKNVETKLLGNV